MFEDISEKLQSKKFIKCLRELDKKYPQLKMTKDIDLAEQYIEKDTIDSAYQLSLVPAGFSFV
ncbi:hypothetical protein [Cellulosilyticum lentocellum]|uniref:hypothetical protein n=1 Tax=Cellulosilyticum lentocellum TaxID=29360 RepID=UPI00138ABC95|nr:hypothetical protein [Cellulosilyticum lentocellum]